MEISRKSSWVSAPCRLRPSARRWAFHGILRLVRSPDRISVDFHIGQIWVSHDGYGSEASSVLCSVSSPCQVPGADSRSLQLPSPEIA